MSDIIASARSMSTYADGQYVAIGFPKGGLTPATITAMVGFSKGQGLQVNESVGQAMSAMDAKIATLDPNVDGVLITQITNAKNKLNDLSDKIFAGGPAAFMQKFNAARGHIADSIELKKVTAFTANQSLDSFGSGMQSISSLSTNGLDGALGDMTAASKAMTAAGSLFDLSDMANFGSSTGLINKLTSSKMSNSTGINAALANAGITDLTNPANADKIDKVMASITDPKVLKDVADQFNISPPGGLPDLGTQPFASSSLNTDAAATVLGDAPAPIEPSPVELSANANKWNALNNLGGK